MLYIPVYLVFTPIISAIIIFSIHKKQITILAFLSQVIITVLSIIYFTHYKNDLSSTSFTFGGWNPLIGIGFRNDQLSISLIFLTIFMWWMVLIYTYKYKTEYRNFLFFFLFLEGVFLGLLQTNDLFNMFVFIELMTVIVTILVAYKKSGESYKAAIYYLLINSAGILCFLLGIVLIYYTLGNINISHIESMMSNEELSNTITLKFAFVFILASISVKSALFPLYTWLPRAHSVAESGVSALLSGIVVKGGIYVLIRITHMFEPAGYDISSFLMIIGILTAIIGVVFAMSKTDIKQILAYHTMSQIGIILIGLSFLSGDGFYGGFIHIVNHALFKSLLFFGAGIISHKYNTRNVTEIRGVFKTMPIFSILMIIGMLSITGAPLFNGFISKSIIKHDLSHTQYYLLQIVNIGTATSFIKISQIFVGDKTNTQNQQSLKEYIPMFAIAFSCIILGELHIPIWNQLLQIDLHTYKAISLYYIVEYITLLLIGFILFKFIISKQPKIIKKVKNYTMSFETANILFLGYLTILIIVYVL